MALLEFPIFLQIGPIRISCTLVKKLYFKSVIATLLQHNVCLSQSPHKMIIEYPKQDIYTGLSDTDWVEFQSSHAVFRADSCYCNVISFLMLTWKLHKLYREINSMFFHIQSFAIHYVYIQSLILFDFSILRRDFLHGWCKKHFSRVQNQFCVRVLSTAANLLWINKIRRQ